MKNYVLKGKNKLIKCFDSCCVSFKKSKKLLKYKTEYGIKNKLIKKTFTLTTLTKNKPHFFYIFYSDLK